jgi:hypothetical protein
VIAQLIQKNLMYWNISDPSKSILLLCEHCQQNKFLLPAEDQRDLNAPVMKETSNPFIDVLIAMLF